MAAQNADPTDKKKYIKMDPMLQYINKHFISISKQDNDKVQPILKFVIETIIAGLKENALFKKMYTDVLYGGSSYSGLKVGKPEEFDMDLRLVLPALTKPVLELSNEPGFVKYRMTDWATFEKNLIYADFKGLNKLKDGDNYIIADQVLNWFKSTLILFLNGKKNANGQIHISYKDTFVEIRVTTSGPAVTLRVTCGETKFDVDLVVVFRMQEKDWPAKPFKEIPNECDHKAREFMLVPKVPKNESSETKRCWRMSFQQQENILLKMKDNCKTSLRIIKKIRDKQNHKMISSYFIKTVFLHEQHQQTREFWSYPLSFVLMQMLKKYKTYLDDGNIPYYWNKQNNLLQHINKITIDNFKYFIGRVIDSTERNIVENPYKIADYISTDEEIQLLTTAGFVTKEIIEMPVKCSGSSATVVDNNSVIKTDNNFVIKTDNYKTLIFMLKGIQTSINVVQSDMKCALKKLADLKHVQAVQDLKNENIVLKTMSKGFMEQDQFTDKLKQQELVTADIMDQVQCLNKSVEVTDNELRKWRRIPAEVIETETAPTTTDSNKWSCTIS